MQKKTAPRREPVEVPEVVEFLDAQDAIQAFKTEHAEVFDQLAQLVERYNTALEQADKACRSKEVSCGPFDLYQFTTKYNAEALFNAVGRDNFLTMGGKMETITQFSVDRGRLEACIAQGKLPNDVVEHVRKETPNFHKPDPLVVP
jgi:hypothetical protein